MMSYSIFQNFGRFSWLQIHHGTSRLQLGETQQRGFRTKSQTSPGEDNVETWEVSTNERSTKGVTESGPPRALSFASWRVTRLNVFVFAQFGQESHCDLNLS